MNRRRTRNGATHSADVHSTDVHSTDVHSTDVHSADAHFTDGSHRPPAPASAPDSDHRAVPGACPT